jgi:hypothetical protein
MPISLILDLNILSIVKSITVVKITLHLIYFKNFILPLNQLCLIKLLEFMPFFTNPAINLSNELSHSSTLELYSFLSQALKATIKIDVIVSNAHVLLIIILPMFEIEQLFNSSAREPFFSNGKD